MEIQARNVNDAAATALRALSFAHVERSSRNGPVIAFHDPVMTVYQYPTERVLFSPIRNANPVFHLMESLWMLAGRNDVKFPATFVKNMAKYSDDSVTLNGAYGHRWRQHFGWNQLKELAKELRKSPESRRAVLTMWDGGAYLEQYPMGDWESVINGGKDVPCNTHAYFDLRDGRLSMTMCCRSNDIYWGCYGANAVHMSVLLEYMAAAVGVPVGVYRQFSNDLHLYTEIVDKGMLIQLSEDITKHDLYCTGTMVPAPLMQQGETVEDFDADLELFFESFDAAGVRQSTAQQYETAFFNFTVVPMLRAWQVRKNFDGAPRLAEKIASPDWAHATKQWLIRNYAK